MTSEAQRIAIATVCGHTNFKYFNTTNVDGAYTVLASDQTANGWEGYDATEIPNYLEDLNAMHEAEKLILAGNHIGYCRAVLVLVCPETKGVIVGLNAGYGLSILHATASQRAEAFLRTLNLWDDSK